MHINSQTINSKEYLMKSESDTEILTRTIYGEARGATDLDKRAVAWVIRNRATAANAYQEKYKKLHPHFGTGDIKSACMAKAQFSCWNEGNPNYKVISQKELLTRLGEGTTIDGRALKACSDAAQKRSGETDPTFGSKHYFMQNRKLPNWTTGKTPVLTTKAHLYYNNIF